MILRPGPFLIALFFLQVGLVLLVLPWTPLWDRNLLFEWSGPLHDLTRSPYVRGGVSGLGLVNLGIGIAELFQAWRHYHDEERPRGVLSALDEVRRGRA